MVISLECVLGTAQRVYNAITPSRVGATLGALAPLAPIWYEASKAGEHPWFGLAFTATYGVGLYPEVYGVLCPASATLGYLAGRGIERIQYSLHMRNRN